MYSKLICILSFLLTMCASASSVKADAGNTRPLAFVHVNVIPMTQVHLLRNQTVIIDGNRIIQIGPSNVIRVPRNALRIDGRGKYLMPGLVDCHVHLRDGSELLSYLAHGITTIVHMGGPAGNILDVIVLRRRIATNEILGPNVYTTGRILDGNPPINPNVSTVVSTPDEARSVVEDQYRAGVDFIKVYNNLTSGVLQAVVEAAHQRGLAVIGHIPRREGRTLALQAALAARQDMIAHGEEFFFTYFYGDTEKRLDLNLLPQPDRSKIPFVVQLVRKAGAVVTPNLSFVAMTRRQLDDLGAVLSDPESRYLHPNVRAVWHERNPTRRPDLARFSLREREKYAFLRELIPAFQTGGILLLLGTDSSAPGMFPGKSAHVELRELVAAGLTPYQALATGTRNAGEFIKTEVREAPSFGTVSIGQRADLLLLRANPLTQIDNISQIAGVMVNGRWLPKLELEQMRSDTVNSFNR